MGKEFGLLQIGLAGIVMLIDLSIWLEKTRVNMIMIFFAGIFYGMVLMIILLKKEPITKTKSNELERQTSRSDS